MSKEIVKTESQNTGLVVAPDYGADAGAGIADLDPDVLSLPYITVLQALSPQCNEGESAFIQEARPGMILNSVTLDLFDGKTGLIIQPVSIRQVYAEWVSRDEGGGKVTEHLPESECVREAQAAATEWNDLRMPNGHLLERTFYMTVLTYANLDDQNPTPAIISMTSTKIAPFRKFVTRLSALQGGRVPLFANRVRLTTVLEKNSAGQPYYNFAYAPAVGKSFLESLLPPDSPFFLSAKKFRDSQVK